jgi:hypothetical protein
VILNAAVANAPVLDHSAKLNSTRQFMRELNRLGMLSAGVPVGGGSDATRVASYNPWVSLYWMVTGRTVGGHKFMVGTRPARSD